MAAADAHRFLFCVDFVAVLSRLRFLQVVHVGHPGSIVPDNGQLS